MVEAIMISIPSEYNFAVRPDKEDEINCFQLTRIPLGEGDDHNDDEKKVENTYSLNRSNTRAVHIDIPSYYHKAPLSEHLQDLYKNNTPMAVFPTFEENNIVVKNIYKQTKRLKYCIRGVQHKLCIKQQGYMTVLDDGDNIVGFSVERVEEVRGENYSPRRLNTLDADGDERCLYIVINFKIFHDKVKNIETEVNRILSSVYDILNSNHQTHAINIKKILQDNNEILQHSQEIYQNKLDYQGYLNKYRTHLSGVLKEEEIIKEELEALVNQSKNLKQQVKNSQAIKKSQKRLEELEQVKNELVETILELKKNHENVILKTDMILFDNLVMLDKIILNVSMLNKLKVD
jgi:hypothetical protein